MTMTTTPASAERGGFNTLLFVCAICEREIRDYPFRNGRDRHLPPLCRGCESTHTYSWNGRSRELARITDGSPMDRRKAKQVFALSDALHSEAATLNWKDNHGRA